MSADRRTPLIRTLEGARASIAGAAVTDQERAAIASCLAELDRAIASGAEPVDLAPLGLRLEDRWVAGASHEIRNFLAVMKIRIDMSLRSHKKGRPVDLEELLSLLSNSVDGMTSLVADMLDVSRAQAGTLPISRVSFAVDELVRRIADALVTAAPNHRLSLEAESVRVLADPLRCEQVLTNVIRNAIHYSADGGAISIAVSRDHESAVVCVRDQGVGFEPASAERIFEPFLQLHERGGGADPGLGLGLFLARALTTRMGGAIVGASEGPGRGASFTITLPLDRGDRGDRGDST